MERASLLRLLLACSLRSPASAAGVRQSAPEALECECDKVRCTCTKQCDCLLAQEGSFLQTLEVPVAWDDAAAESDGATYLQSEADASHAAFLQAAESSSSALMPAAGSEETLRCDCQKVRCNCLKRCDCARESHAQSAYGGYGAAASLVQISESAELLPDAAAEAPPRRGAAAAPRARHRSRGGRTLALEAAACSVSVSVAGASGEDAAASCFSAPAAVTVSGDGASAFGVVVWDTETGICGEGELYVHYVPGQSPAAMTAGAGALKHTYKACAFDSVPVSGTGCQVFSGTGCRSECETKEWEVARVGSSC